MWLFEIRYITRGVFGTPILREGRESRRGSSIVPLERAMMVFYTLPIMTFALSLTIRPQFAIECLNVCDAQLIGGGSLWVKILGCSLWSRFMMLGSAESEHPRLTNREIIFESFQPMWSRYLKVTDGQSDGERETTCRSNTALCVASRGKNSSQRSLQTEHKTFVQVYCWSEFFYSSCTTYAWYCVLMTWHVSIQG